MPIHRIEVNAPAAPRTPNSATPTASRRCVGVATGNACSGLVVFVGGGLSVMAPEEEKKEVGRAMRKTPRNEMREAYWEDLVNGSFRKR